MKTSSVPSTIDLLDVNVWLALSFHEHRHYERAYRYWQEQSAPTAAFCRVTALGLVRVSTLSASSSGTSFTIGEAWRLYEAWRSLPEVVLLREPDACEAALGRFVEDENFRPRHWTDAYLAAFARSSGSRLVTFDRDFRRFPDLELLELS